MPRCTSQSDGLNETGDVEGRNLAIEYRFADGQNDRPQAIFAELIRRQVLVIVLAGFGAVLHSVRASPIPIVFNTGDDPHSNRTPLDRLPSIRRRPSRMRIFLSYGHDRNTRLVERIRVDLQERGHDVWIDTSEIKSGEDWRRRIVEGLKASDWTLGFLSRYSTRDPGVCLDELAIALHAQGGTIATILVEAESEVRPPVSVSHIQWLDMHDWETREAKGGAPWEAWYCTKLDKLLALLASPATMRLAGEIESLERRLTPVSQQADVGRLVDGFVGRERLLKELEAWRVHDMESRFFWITGAPGTGKSAFTAWRAHQGRANVIGLNLCLYNVEARRNPAQVIRTLAFQIASRLPDYRRLLLDRLERHDPDGSSLRNQGAADLFHSLLIEPLTLGIDGGRRENRYLVIIDALDETIRDGRSELAEILAEYAPKLPKWIALVVTSRPEDPILRQFSAFHPHKIDGNSPKYFSDAREFVREWLAPGIQAPAELERLIDKVVDARNEDSAE